MTGSEYQALAMRTNDGYARDRLSNKLLYGIMKEKDVAGLLNGLMGLSGESGELMDLFKKWIFHEADLNEEHAQKELGDVMWYVAMICHSMGWSLDAIMEQNIEKLRERYPEGFDTELSNHRKETDI